MRGAYGGPRVLLRRLREVMTEPATAQERLDKIVVLIASNMVAEVCSVYVLRVDGTLELYATEGLNRAAVHLTSLKIGEGLVGLIAREAEPLNLADAQAHPAFAYRPETGEEIYHSFLGVPVLRAGNTLGVLVVQNKAHRTYSEEEVEALQTTAMVLAEMIASGELTALAKPGAEPVLRRPVTQSGEPLSDGIGLGHAVLYDSRVGGTKNLISDDPQAELDRLDTAFVTLRSSIDDMLDRGDMQRGGEHREVLEAFRMFANDQGWVRRIREAVLGGLTAEAAVERVQSDTRARMQRMMDPYLRERLHDLDDLANRLMRALAGDVGPAAMNLPDNAIIVARNMGPAALLDFERGRVRGLILEDGGPTSHIAIVARALGVPAVGQIANATSLMESGDAVIVDGDAGQIHVRPMEDIERTYAEKVRFRARRQRQYAALRDKPSVTRDGKTITLLLNAGLMVDLPHLAETNAAGIGLFRTELQFMVADSFPRTGEQQALYSEVLDAAKGKSVTFRTLDIGGDKVLPYLRAISEENPALGWRAIRLGLDRPGLLRSQIRALAKAASGRELKVMFPMVTAVWEFDQARALFERELTHLRRWGYDLPERVHLGCMVEVPALLYQLEPLMERVDFVSVGSNDLFQYLLASDRGNTRVASRFDTLNLPFLRALRSVVRAADKANVPVTLCGELASRPLEAVALVALGFRAISMSPSAIGPVKAALLALDTERAADLVNERLDDPKAVGSLREALSDFAAAEGIPI
ncbi:phosphoenolpyruvate--protein phosphotransferase [Agaricicola taiwanensis]|uniref:phosphoenolpyruvate--protein phosphotransferase n=1 Tax=Agaricicola taiwanensis TaxID=591372 RepID=A0A8J2YN72_9RHOB|nr:phosphoenolpyruvate--protein phosphotransferase [Agaricicola taiwanensis]GGE55405.1 phosphoenolpyruvate--protein phosphotransferase [Agaricicola taiwanensis]